MFWAVIRKEFFSGLKTPRFVITSILSLTLLPLSTSVNLRDCQNRLQYYQEALQAYERVPEDARLLEGPASEGFRPPNPNSVLVSGLEGSIPTRVRFLPEGVRIISGSGGLDNPFQALPGHLDLATLSGIVFSLLALLFVYRMIPGDRASAALRLELSTPISRDELFLGKLIGNYALFCLPLLAGFWAAAAVLITSGLAGEPDLLSRLAFLIGLTLLFVLGVFSLGAFVSMFTRRSAPSLAALVLVWVLVTLVIPALAPLVAEAIHPAAPRELIDIEKSQILSRLDEEHFRVRDSLFKAVMNRYHVEAEYHTTISIDNLPPDARNAWIEFNRKAKELGQEYLSMLVVSYISLEGQYARRYRTRGEIAVVLARLSPAACYGFAASSAAGTGHDRWLRLIEKDRWYERHVDELKFSEVGFKLSGLRSVLARYPSSHALYNDPPRPRTVHFANASLSESLQAAGPDVVLLSLSALIALLAGLIRFRSYDVR